MNMHARLKVWIEAMRLRTLPVSVAGVVAACGYAAMISRLHPVPALLCLLFAVLAQIASNFANEYFDHRAGLDRKGREGPRRGVTEGDISPSAMLAATIVTVLLACVVGCSLILWGGLWLILVGIAIVIGIFAYSTGPYPLSHHGLGEVAVVLFFGVIPVNLTFYIVTGFWSQVVMSGSFAYGLMGANVLIVNNYRDRADDRRVGKRTLAVIIRGHRTIELYLVNGFVAAALLSLLAWIETSWILLPLAFYLIGHIAIWRNLERLKGAQLNPYLGRTSMLMLAEAVAISFTLFATKHIDSIL